MMYHDTSIQHVNTDPHGNITLATVRLQIQAQGR